MSAQFNPLDTSQRQKVLNIIAGLSDAGLSEADIMRYFGLTRDLGQQNLLQSFGAAQDQLGLAFQPELMNARDTLGANPLLADSGYANRLNRQIMSDIAARQGAAYSSAAADEAQRQTDYLRSLFDQRTGLRSGLAGQAYQTMTGLPKKKTTGQQLGEAGLQLGGAAVGALLGGPAGAVAGYQGGQALGGGGGSSYAPQPSYAPYAPRLPYGTQAVPLGGPRRSMYRPFGDQ